MRRTNWRREDGSRYVHTCFMNIGLLMGQKKRSLFEMIKSTATPPTDKTRDSHGRKQGNKEKENKLLYRGR